MTERKEMSFTFEQLYTVATGLPGYMIFAESKNNIAGQPGCHGVQLLEGEGHFFTFSHWESEADLNAYRESALFGEVWPKTKALFYDKPQAWTCHKTDSSEA